MDYEQVNGKPVFGHGCVNLDPKAKNISNCDISGSFYTIGLLPSKPVTPSKPITTAKASQPEKK